MAIAAAPAVAGAAKKTAQKVAGAKKKTAPQPSKGKGDLPGKGDWRTRAGELAAADKAAGRKPKAQRTGSLGKWSQGDQGKYRRMLIAEFIICVIILGLSPLSHKPGEMGPIRFMKRGSATCAFFIILGLVSSAGRGASRAAAMFGALVTLVLLVDQREAFGKLATVLATTKEDEAADAADFNASAGPDDSTATDENPGMAAV